MACTSFSAGENASVTLGLGSVVVNPCPQTIQAMAQAIVNAMTASLPGNFATFNIGSDVPAPANQDKLWYRVDASCNPLGWFIYSGGAWVRATPIGTPPGMVSHWYSASCNGVLAEDRARISFIDTGDTYPGGGSTTLHTNPFWLLCDGTTVGGLLTPDLQGRTIVGAGAGSGLTVRAYDATGGEENHVLTESELAAHKHLVPTGTIPGVGATGQSTWEAYGSAAAVADTRTAVADAGLGGTVFPYTSSDGSDSGHNTMQPFRCLYPIIRTARTI